MINPLDRPAILPRGVEPKTVTEMAETLAHRFMGSGAEAPEALRRAEVAVGALIASGHLLEWGMSERGEPVYVPKPSSVRTDQVVVYLW